MQADRVAQTCYQNVRNETNKHAADTTRATLRNARKNRTRTIKRWEREYWDDVAASATDAWHRGDQGVLYKLFGELKLRGHEGRKDTGRSSVPDVEAEREAWKTHFERVSQGRGNVHARVWANCPRSDKTYDWLTQMPSTPELDKCVANMKTKRAPGLDGFVAELLKYGGSKLRTEVYKVVRQMWEHAKVAGLDMEAHDWPAEWKVGVVVPLWKKKGKREDKNTWRGITLLSGPSYWQE